MKLKQVWNYHLYDLKSAVFIFYGVVGVLALFSTFSFTLNNGTVSMGGMEFGTVIFLFIAGLNSFRGSFHFLLANGIPRKTQFFGFLLSVPVLAGLLVIIDTLLALLISQFISYESLYMQLYSRRYSFPLEAAMGSFLLEKMLWSFFVYLTAMMLGFLITVLYYRMNKLTKVLVSVSVPLFFVIALPFLDTIYFNGNISYWFFQGLVRLAFGFAHGANPYIAMFSNLVLFSILSLLSWVLMRRAVIKG